MSGNTDDHPSGLCGKAWIIPENEGKSTWDTHPSQYQFSEWYHAYSDDAAPKKEPFISFATVRDFHKAIASLGYVRSSQ